MNGDGAGRKRNDWLNSRPRRVEQSLRFAVRHEPALLIAHLQWIDLFEGFAHQVAFINFECQVSPQRGRPVRHMPPGSFRQNDPDTRHVSSPA
jgi:hypothetical protein